MNTKLEFVEKHSKTGSGCDEIFKSFDHINLFTLMFNMSDHVANDEIGLELLNYLSTSPN